MFNKEILIFSRFNVSLVLNKFAELLVIKFASTLNVRKKHHEKKTALK